MAGRAGADYRRSTSIDRASRDLPSMEIVYGCLAKITGSTLISASVKRYLYTWVEAEIGPAPSYTPATKSYGIAGDALSISEVSNGTTIAFGVTVGTLPTGFVGVAIPTNSVVWVVPQRLSDGNMMWLILNTQAIDGACP